jgi:uncharacterized membrane protein YdjX (TVP38/TMEM64 family)
MKVRLAFTLVMATAVIVVAMSLPVDDIVHALTGAYAAHPIATLLATAGFIAAGFLLLLPASLLMMLAGFLFGLAKGLAVVWLAGLAASSLAFWAGRTVARPWSERRARRRVLFRAIDRAIRSKGFLVVLLTRIVMLLPFPALNYMLGLSAVRFRDYMAGTNLGMLLPYFLFVYLGSTLESVSALLQGELSPGRREILLGAAALAAVLLLAVLIVRVAWNTLRAKLARTQDQA